MLQGSDEVLIFTAHDGNSDKKKALTRMGAQVIVIPNAEGAVDLKRLMTILAELEINEVLVEAGRELNGALIEAGLVDEMIFYLAPHLLGDDARGMIKLPELTGLDQRRKLKIQDVRMIGQDIRIIARFPLSLS